MWEAGGVHGTHEALLLQAAAAAGGSGAAGADYGHPALLPPWLGPAAAAAPGFSYMSPHPEEGLFGAEAAAAASAPFGGLLGGYSDGAGQLGVFGLAEPPPALPPPPHALGLAAGGPSMVSGILGTLQAELGRMTAKEIMDAKALAASRSHSEAERRRRQRINSHLARLRSLLPNTTKTDKASLLAEVIEHVKELKRQTSAVLGAGGAEEAEADGEAAAAPRHHHHLLLPTEADELAVDAAEDGEASGGIVVRASLCCEDRAGLIPDIARALAALRLRARRAEIATLGGRVRNVLLITADEEGDEEEGRGDGDGCGGGASFANRRHELVASIQEALRAVIDRKTATSDTSSSSGGGGGGGSGGTKRQRMSGAHEQGSL
ncbi:hypothetical protein U9M48_038841 [Paspalum notatum var. saurae]|uniref:BHLH domain-containing protein n=1 Tax=Paspalum notatum var. saurae TaxID=547442 RepID=A0AAQ3XBH1_PASNO